MIAETAYAKLNLALHVRRRRADGYHDIESVFAFCDDGDRLTGERSDTLTLGITGPFADALGADADNLVIRAARAFAEAAGLAAGARLMLDKRLPVASGIGGGSADAAAALRLLNRLWELDWPLARLAPIAAALGADVPACLASTTVRGERRGDVLTPTHDDLAGRPVLLVNPSVAVSTAAVFAGWDGVDRGALGDWRSGRNDLKAPATAIAPEIAPLIEMLAAQTGVVLSRMSGSGATVFALFDDAVERDRAAAALAGGYPDYWLMSTQLR